MGYSLFLTYSKNSTIHNGIPMKKSVKPYLLILPLIILLIGLFFLVQPAGAHAAGKLQLSAVPAGPYQTSVWSSPDPAAVGELHVALSVVSADDASPVFDAAVLVQMTSQEDGTAISAPATIEDSANKFLYEAIMEPADPGLYLVTIDINGRDGGNGVVSFELEVIDEPGFNPLYLIPIGLALAAGSFLILSRRGRSLKDEEKVI